MLFAFSLIFFHKPILHSVLKYKLERAVKKALGAEVKIGELDLHWSKLALNLKDLRVKHNHRPLLAIKKIHMALSSASLFPLSLISEEAFVEGLRLAPDTQNPILKKQQLLLFLAPLGALAGVSHSSSSLDSSHKVKSSSLPSLNPQPEGSQPKGSQARGSKPKFWFKKINILPGADSSNDSSFEGLITNVTSDPHLIDQTLSAKIKGRTSFPVLNLKLIKSKDLDLSLAQATGENLIDLKVEGSLFDLKIQQFFLEPLWKMTLKNQSQSGLFSSDFFFSTLLKSLAKKLNQSQKPLSIKAHLKGDLTKGGLKAEPKGMLSSLISSSNISSNLDSLLKDSLTKDVQKKIPKPLRKKILKKLFKRLFKQKEH